MDKLTNRSCGGALKMRDRKMRDQYDVKFKGETKHAVLEYAGLENAHRKMPHRNAKVENAGPGMKIMSSTSTHITHQF